MRTELAYRMLVTLLFVSEQWGDTSATPAKGWVNFPITFNEICFTCVPVYTDYGASPTYTSTWALSKQNKMGFNFRTANNSVTLNYIAIGM